MNNISVTWLMSHFIQLLQTIVAGDFGKNICKYQLKTNTMLAPIFVSSFNNPFFPLFEASSKLWIDISNSLNDEWTLPLLKAGWLTERFDTDLVNWYAACDSYSVD